jgi:hypothetical protein
MWIPVLFACAIGQECKFYSDPVMVDQKACIKYVDSHIEALEKSGRFRAATGACIPVKFEGGKPI